MSHMLGDLYFKAESNQSIANHMSMDEPYGSWQMQAQVFKKNRQLDQIHIILSNGSNKSARPLELNFWLPMHLTGASTETHTYVPQ